MFFHLKNNGYLIIIPSINLLYSKYDNAVGHVKRYNKKDFFDMKINQVLKLKKLSTGNVLLFAFFNTKKILMMAFRKQ